MEIKAIETIYNGHKFRSRLEARWAIFFDALNIKWRYEPEGFEKEWGDKKILYLPDFHLPDKNIWVEIKPSPEILAKDGGKIGPILDWGSPIPGIDESRGMPDGGLLLLYDIPNLRWGIVLHPILVHHKGLFVQYAIFGGFQGLRKLSDQEISIFKLFLPEDLDHHYFDASAGFEENEWIINQYLIPTQRAYQNVLDAYEKARHARFEHGYRN